MLEKTIEEIVKRHTAEIWPDLPLEYVESQRRLPNGKILDLSFRDRSSNCVLVVELKRYRVTAAVIRQLAGYLSEMRKMEPEVGFRGMVVGFQITSGYIQVFRIIVSGNQSRITIHSLK